MNVHIIRVNGSEEHTNCTLHELRGLLAADALDGFSLRDGRYVYVDDSGHEKDLPVNAKATALYQGICKPGVTWQIVGDVAIVIDKEFA